jgi:DNA-binding transcriptional ArsR family regulator
MVKNKGYGEKQENDYKKARNKILEILNDRKKHRYNKLLKETGLSTATLTKHLKELAGIVQKHIEMESGEYPYPVYYTLDPLMIEDTPESNRNLESKPKSIEQMLFEQHRTDTMQFFHYLRKVMDIKIAADLPEEKKSRYYQQWIAHAISHVSENMEATLRYIIENGLTEWEEVFGKYETFPSRFFQDLIKYESACAKEKAEKDLQVNKAKKVKTETWVTDAIAEDDE